MRTAGWVLFVMLFSSAGWSDTSTPLQVRVRDLGPQFTSNTAGVLGHDCAYSVPLPDGRALWLFGDTYLENRNSTEPRKRDLRNLICNCMAVVPRQDVTSGIQQFEYARDASGVAKAVLEYFPNEHGPVRRLWPMHGIALPEGEKGGCKIVLFYSMVDIDDNLPPPGNITHLGIGIATANVARAGDPVSHFDRLTSAGEPILWGVDQPAMGSAVLRDPGDNIIWVYAMRPGKKHDVIVARTTPDKITTASGFEFYTGQPEQLFSPDFEKAAHQFDGVPTEMSVTWSPALHKYLAIHTFLIFPEIFARTADHPTGPWTEGATIFKAKPVTGNRKTFYYAAKQHAELARDGGRTTYVTYVDSEEYWPRMLELCVDSPGTK